VNHLKTSKALAVIALLDSLVMAVGHVPLIRAIFFSFPIGAYFLFSTVVYVLGGIFVVSGRLFKLSNFGLIIMAIVDNVLLIYTRTMPNIFFHRTIPWSWEWFPLGTVQIFIGQAVIIVLCAILLYEAGLQEAQRLPSLKHP
jgi:hypothetical protein